MNYKRIYEKFIESRKDRVLEENLYYETHHINPKSLGGLDSNDNLVKLTAKEHYFAHLLLAKFAGPKMVIALSYFIQDSNRYDGGVKYKPTSKNIARIREQANLARSSILKGRTFSEEHKKNLSKSKIGKIAHNKGVPAKEEQKRKQSESMKGKKPWNKGITGKDYLDKVPNHKNPPKLNGYKWINDGKIQRKLPPNEYLPGGWKFGRLDITGDNNPMRKNKNDV